MSDPFEGITPDRNKQDPELNDQMNLAETVLAALQMASDLQKEHEILPTTTQYQLAIPAHQFRSPELLLPQDFLGLVETDKLNLAIVTFVFGHLEDRPYIEVRLETEETVVATFSKPGIDKDQPYSGSIILDHKEYRTPVTPESVADLFDQIVVPSLDGVPISDPQFPPQARNIIDTLIQSQQADSVESVFYDFEISSDTEKTEPQHYKVQLHSINGQPYEIEIEWVLHDTLSFNTDSGSPEQNYRSVSATLSFDDFTQSVQFVRIEAGQEPVKLLRDGELLTILREKIDAISHHFGQEQD